MRKKNFTAMKDPKPNVHVPKPKDPGTKPKSPETIKPKTITNKFV